MQISDLLPTTFGMSLTNSTRRTPNYLLDMTFNIHFGNTYNKIFFKDIRVWNYKRSAEQLYTYRFKQIDS